MANSAPIFVVGTPRSGTTLWARILGQHSRIFMPGETHFFDDIYSKRREFGELHNAEAMKQVIERLQTIYGRYNEPGDQERVNVVFAGSDTWKSIAESCFGYCEVLSRFMEVQMIHDGKVRWGNNAPRDLFNIEDVVACYPNVKVIACVRDIRDFLISYKDKWKVTSSEHESRLKTLYHPVVTSLLWKASMRAVETMKRKVPQDNLAIVRYEDLVLEPAIVVRKVCEVIEEEFEEEMLEIDTNNSSSQTDATGIFNTSIGRWRDKLSNEEVWLAQKIGGEELRKLGYKVEHLSPRAGDVVRVVASSPGALCRALKVNSGMRGPLLPYLIRRVRALLSEGSMH